ncbi:MAG: hypothetical protein ACI8XV_003245 [Arenicella sp.]|jgi:hypothetical protein
MLKELLFENTTVISKYLIVVIIACLAFILYISKLNHTGPNSNAVGGVVADVQDVLPTLAPNNKAVGGIISGQVLTDNRSAGSEIRLAFQAANGAIRQGDSASARSVLVQLTTEYPELPEPYANLASLLAADGQLSEARAVLLQGLQAHKGYAALFSNLQKVQGALAANAYRSALADQATAITQVTLPLMDNIDLPQAPGRFYGLDQQMQATKNQYSEPVDVDLKVAEQELKVNN